MRECIGGVYSYANDVRAGCRFGQKERVGLDGQHASLSTRRISIRGQNRDIYI